MNASSKLRTAPVTRRALLRAAAMTPFVFVAEAGDDPCMPNPFTHVCDTPDNPLLKSGFPLHKARDFDLPSAISERPLWSALSKSEKDRDEYLALLSRAYSNLASLPPSDKSSSTFQMWTHELFCGAGRQRAMNTGNPGADLQAGFDVHSNYYFLPWHRAFIFFHERLLQSQLPHNPDFRLPVYDWENTKGQDLPLYYAKLPMIYNTCHPLSLGFSSQSMPQVSQCQVQAWLVGDSIADFVGGPTCQSSGAAAGGPHSYIHWFLGNLMYRMDTAAADPVFWAHHANVDRYWEHWARKYSGEHWFKTYESYWPKGYFYFYDKGGKPARISIRQMLDPAQLKYKYSPPTVSLAPHDNIPLDLKNPSLTMLSRVFGDVLTALSIPADPARSPAEAFIEAYNRIDPSRFSLPVKLTGVPDRTPPEGYYLVAVRDPAKSGRDGVGVIGGFAVMPGHAHSAKFVSTSCLELQALGLMAAATRANLPLDLVYGAADRSTSGFSDYGDLRPFNVVECKLRMPRDPANLFM